jgi:prepilin-type processing-associated H-X9-DG protein
VLNALSKLLEQHLRYVEGANFLRLDGSVRCPPPAVNTVKGFAPVCMCL